MVAPITEKARDPFLCVKNKMGPVLDLEVGRQPAIVLPFVKAEAPQAIEKKIPSHKRRGKIAMSASFRVELKELETISKGTSAYN